MSIRTISLVNITWFWVKLTELYPITGKIQIHTKLFKSRMGWG